MRTCAGLPVVLVPRGLGTGLYVAGQFSGIPGRRTTRSDAAAVPAEIEAVSRRTVCTSQGRFSFTGVADGEYYVIARVQWQAPTRYGLTTQGGDVVTRATVAGGQAVDLIVTGQ